jgi:hypothetical protein
VEEKQGEVDDHVVVLAKYLSGGAGVGSNLT